MKMSRAAKNSRRPEPGDASLNWMALMHVICCGGTLLVFALISAGVSIPLAFLARAVPYLAIAGGILAAGALLWFFQRRCSICPWSPTNKTDVQSQSGSHDVKAER
ncbi:MAG: hypothetical protein LC776_06395 [Acidobacteria bacterium]|nr:hypothetical protein [Acidobacteriota bacterium]